MVANRLPLPTRRGLTREQAAEFVGVSPGTLDKLVAEGRMPAPWRPGARAVFDLAALNLALDRENGLTRNDTPGTGAPDNSWDAVLQ